jgi:hypothetical protein
MDILIDSNAAVEIMSSFAPRVHTRHFKGEENQGVRNNVGSN